MSLVERLRTAIKQATDWNGSVMTRWDEIRGQVEKYKGSDLPRQNFEQLIDDFVELLTEAADEIERLRTEVEWLTKHAKAMDEECEASMAEIAAGRAEVEHLRTTLQRIADMEPFIGGEQYRMRDLARAALENGKG